MNGEHHWSGWPGAYCLHCGSSDPMEYAIAVNSYDPITDVWASTVAAYQFERDMICPGSLGQELDCGQCRAYI